MRFNSLVAGWYGFGAAALIILATVLLSPYMFKAESDDPNCRTSNYPLLRRKGEVPQIALAAFLSEFRSDMVGEPLMADAGEPFQRTDLIIGKRLPSVRFSCAQQIDEDKLLLHYELGGLAYSQNSALLERTGDMWFVRRMR